MTLYVPRALGYIFRIRRSDLTQLIFKYRNKKEIVYGTNLYHKTVKQFKKFSNDSIGNKPICVRKTTTFSRLKLQKVTLRCRGDRSQLSRTCWFLFHPKISVLELETAGSQETPATVCQKPYNTRLRFGRPKF